MDFGRRRSTGSRGASNNATSVVVAGSVWETRMKLDEVKGGFKVFNGEANSNNDGNGIGESVVGTRVAKRAQSQIANGGKRKTWKSEPFEGFERSPIQIARGVKSVGPASAARRLKPAPDPPEPPERAEAGSEEEPKCEEKEISVEAEGPEKVISGEVEGPECKLDDNDNDDLEEIKEEEIEIKEIKDQESEVEEIKRSEEAMEMGDEAEKVEKVVEVSEVKRVNFERKLEVKNKDNFSNKIFHQKQAETVSSLNVKKQSPVIKRATLHSTLATPNKASKSTKFSSNSASQQKHHSFPESHSRLQSFVDLIMWKDISRSVFIFGIGTFTIISSSYTKDLNISFISVISYLSLVYLAAIFLFRSIVCRGVIDMDYKSYVIGEGEAIWLLKLVLPYLNEFLLKLKALFSGDPATTMKLAALLFVLARCGSSITIWTMAKLGFFGVFTVPKVCSLYSTHITAYAKFWARRFRDAWDSCSHKKGVTVAVFLLVWNLSSIIARIWAVFMLFVAFRYYQQNLVADDWAEDGEEGEETWHEPIGDQKQGPGPTIIDITKQKKKL